ncbi:MAG TPA: T9SS type A sorting domain-containing protein [Ferruginibacter sp.]|nr:T9SS type A sorting domain-containing protein [Ferruginibacter sp.]
MKKLLPLLIILVFISNFVTAQYVSIPDNNFRAFLQTKYPSSFNGANMLDTTSSAIVNETTLEVGGLRIVDFTGIQYFTSLTYLDCSQNQIVSLPTLPGSLTYLDCSEDRLDTLANLPNSLTYLDCSMNALNNLPALPTALTYFDCHQNYWINSLPALPNTLQFVDCSENRFSGSFPVLPGSITHFNSSQTYFSGTVTSLPSSLTYLDCSQASLSGSIPTLPTLLDTLLCNNNKFTGLPALPASLGYLDCSFNLIGTMPSLPSSLTFLNCSTNAIPSLGTLPGSLIFLECDYNQLTSLSSLPASLNTLYCGVNQITNLPTLPNSLQYLDCEANQLTSLPTLPNSIKMLYCLTNALTTLPALPTSLTTLDCMYDQLTSLPALPNSLQSLQCSNNLLTSLPALPSSLEDLNCEKNNIYCLPILPMSLSNISMDIDKIQCIPNAGNFIMIQGFDSTNTPVNYFSNQNPYPLCNPTNNVNQCQAFPVITGHAFYDNNSNGVQDAGELDRPYVELESSDTTYTFTNENGYYQIAATGNIASYTLSVKEPLYYKAVPASVTYNFTSYDTLTTQDYALQPTASVDSLTVKLMSYPNHARPGFQFVCPVNYANVGTTTLSPVIVLNYDDQTLVYDSSSNPSVINNGDSLSLAAGTFVPGQQNSFTAYFTVKVSAIIGDTVVTKVGIAGGSAKAADSIENLISSSYDPNDKEATPILTPQDVANGKAINYTIRFQNTGNDTAFNIVVTDTLSNLLQATSLQIINSSKPCKVTLKGNVIVFEFLNVLLPDNTINSVGSNGFVSFSVKPVSTVTVGTTINNYAAIYFDYNAPIITNTASTVIENVVTTTSQPGGPTTTVDKSIVFNNPVTNTLNINITSSSLNNTRATIFDDQGGMVKKLVLYSGEQAIDMSKSPSGVYYLKTQTSSYKIIVIR